MLHRWDLLILTDDLKPLRFGILADVNGFEGDAFLVAGNPDRLAGWIHWMDENSQFIRCYLWCASVGWCDQVSFEFYLNLGEVHVLVVLLDVEYLIIDVFHGFSIGRIRFLGS